MPRFAVDPTPEEKITFDLPGGDISIEVPFLDSIEPAVLSRVEKKMKSNDVEVTDPESVVYMLEEFCESVEQKKAVHRLTLRQITQLKKIWDKETETSLGEFLDSLESSTKKE